jgi:hypothetical protein
MANTITKSPVQLVTDEAKPAITAATIAAVTVPEPVDPITTAAKAVMDGIIGKYAKSDEAKGLAKGDYEKASEAHDGNRVSLILTIVKAAIKNEWNEVQYVMQGVDLAITAYREGRNSTEDTLTQLRSEIERAIHPKARDHVEHDLERARTMWAEETAATKVARDAAKAEGKSFKKDEVETPLHDSFAKSYHAVFQKGGLLDARAQAATPEDEVIFDNLADFCEARGKKLRRDPKRCANLVRQALKSLQTVAEEYPEGCDDWETVIQFLEGIDYKRLEAARQAREDAAAAEKRQAERAAKMRGKPEVRKAAANAKANASLAKLTD